jgi:transposase-like protein
MKCPNCRREMDLVGKSTVTGDDVREYCCKACNRTEIENRGKALWEILIRRPGMAGAYQEEIGSLIWSLP